jgi:hypothetical protein
MPASSFVSLPGPVGPVVGNRFVKSRTIDKIPRADGQKPYEQLVEDTLGGKPEIKISDRLKLLEAADGRKIRRGDAIDFIESIQRKNRRQHRIPARSRARTFALHFTAFAVVYLTAAAAWCLILRAT